MTTAWTLSRITCERRTESPFSQSVPQKLLCQTVVAYGTRCLRDCRTSAGGGGEGGLFALIHAWANCLHLISSLEGKNALISSVQGLLMRYRR